MTEGFRRRQRRRPRPRDFGNEIIIAIYPLDNDDMKKNLTLNNHGYHHYHCSAPVPKSVWDNIVFTQQHLMLHIEHIQCNLWSHWAQTFTQNQTATIVRTESPDTIMLASEMPLPQPQGRSCD